MPQVLWMTAALAGRIRAHGAETYPHECCGALLGRDVDRRQTLRGVHVSLRARDSPAQYDTMANFPQTAKDTTWPNNLFITCRA